MIIDRFQQDGFVLGEWIPERDDHRLSRVVDDLLALSRIGEPRPAKVILIPAVNDFCRHWAGSAGLATGVVHLCSGVARQLIDPEDSSCWSSAAETVLHEATHVSLGQDPPPVPAPLLPLSPWLGAGYHDPILAAVLQTLYCRCHLSVADLYDCGWHSISERDWPGPDWSLAWARKFGERNAPTNRDGSALARAAIDEFAAEFARRAKVSVWWRRWWCRDGDSNEWNMARTSEIIRATMRKLSS